MFLVFEVERKEDFGGNKAYKTFEEIQEDFKNEVLVLSLCSSKSM